VAGFETILVLLLASTALSVVARWLRVPVPIVMVLGGIAVALVPHLHPVELDPDLAFTIFVPPLLFGAAITTSIRGLRQNLRAVLLLAVGLVIATTLVVGVAARALLHDLDWHGAFVLAAIVAPPDAVVALALAHTLRMPRRAVSVLEGETLLNDTMAFVIYRMAVRAATTGEFDWRMAIPHFLLVAAGGAVVGWGVYHVVRFARRHLHDTVLETVVWLLTPFAAYLPAEAIGVSGVLAVVVAGLLLRRSSPLVVSARTRLQSIQAYEVVEFVLNSLVFILIGLQLGAIFRDPAAPPLADMLRATAVVAGAVMLFRVLWVFPAAYLPRLFPGVRARERRPPVGAVAIVAWTGMRGGDSLVTALALPHVTAAGVALPGRDLIIATTFGVILATLLVQGLTLAPLIRFLRLPPDHAADAEEALARRQMIAAGDAFLARREKDGDIHPKIVARVRRKHIEKSELDIDLNVDGFDKKLGETQRALERELLRTRRTAVVGLQRDQVIDDAVLRQIERELDLEELRLEDEGA
jgi:CPA1 family monovalent cation:H+ antiporter